MNEKERSLIESAQREAAARRRGGSDVARTPSASPLDAPTVVGWDHPAAQETPNVNAEKWQRIAALMESERSENEERRRRMRRGAIAFLVVVLAFALFAVARMLVR